MREDRVQPQVVRTYRLFGGRVCNLSQGYRRGGRRHGTTRQTSGLGDLWVFLPRVPTGLWHETKALAWDDLTKAEQDHLSTKYGIPALFADAFYSLIVHGLSVERRLELYRDKQTPEQTRFEQDCRACNVPYVLGGVEEALAALTELGLVGARA